MSEKFIISDGPSFNVYVTQQDIDDIMVTALEGGICYWCSAAKPIDDYLGEYASEQISRGGSLELLDAEDGRKYTLSLENLLFGIKMLLRENPQLVDEDGRLDIIMIDAELADCIIQYAVFGTLVYG